MARLPRIRLRALDDLARQLRFAPPAAAARNIRAVLELASEIDPARAYGEVWVSRRITGFRREVREPVQLVGEALLADLSAFAERVSSQSRLGGEDLGLEVIGLAGLRDKWGVSARTIERYRRRGLIGVRVIAAGDRSALCFPAASVRRFEEARPELLDSARSYARATPQVRERIAAAARQHRAAHPVSLARTAAAVAPEAGVSVGTARRVLRREGAVEMVERLSKRQRGLAFRGWARGVSMAAIVDRLGTTRSTVHRIINAERAARLRGLDLEGPTPPMAGKPDEWLHAAEVRMGLGLPGDTDAARLAELAKRPGGPDAKRERVLAAAYHFLRGRARGAIAGLSRSPGGAALDRIETDLRWAALLKIELLRGERALVVRTIEERAGGPLLEVAPAEIRRWIEVAFVAAAEAVDRFDPFKRGRLATPISLAIARVLAGLRPSGASRRAHPASVPIADWSRRAAPWQEWLDAPARLRNGEVDRAVRLRFGWGLGPPLTLDELKREHSIAPSRLWRAMSRR